MTEVPMRVCLRPCTVDDMPLILAWRNNPLLYKTLYTQGYQGKGLISWEEHYSWWESHGNLQRRIIWVTDSTGTRSVGYIQFADWGDGVADIGIYIGEITLWGKGIGRRALTIAMADLRDMGTKVVRADVVISNVASQRMFESLGFSKVAGRREGECSYQRGLGNLV